MHHVQFKVDGHAHQLSLLSVLLSLFLLFVVMVSFKLDNNAMMEILWLEMVVMHLA